MIKSISLAAVAVLVMVGCNSGSKSSDNTGATKALSSYSDAEKLAYSIANKGEVLETATRKKKASNKNTKSRSVVSCESGSMEFFFDKPIAQLTDDDAPSKMLFNNCKMDGEVVNGDMQFTTSADGLTETFSTVNGFQVSGGEEPGSILAGGTMSATQDGEWDIMTINLEMEINGVKHGGENLVYRAKDLADGSSIEYPVSGKEKIGDSSYFIVDPAYDASVTPFKTDANGDLISGKFKYIDDEQHSVELEITDKEVVTVRVDKDGNGSFVGDEVSTVKL